MPLIFKFTLNMFVGYLTSSIKEVWIYAWVLLPVILMNNMNTGNYNCSHKNNLAQNLDNQMTTSQVKKKISALVQQCSNTGMWSGEKST